jgi:hypothetical protein
MVNWKESGRRNSSGLFKEYRHLLGVTHDKLQETSFTTKGVQVGFRSERFPIRVKRAAAMLPRSEISYRIYLR